MKGNIGASIGMLHHLMQRFQPQMCRQDAENSAATHMQGRIIHYLYRNREKELFQKDLEAAFSIRRSTATGILKLMEQRGLLRREPVEQDARLKKLVLTEQAIALHSEISRQIQKNEAMVRQGISEQELAVFFAVCDKIKSNLEGEA